MKIKIIFGMLFFMVFLPLCKKGGPTEPVWINLHIEGVVTYSDTNEPVANCRIELWRLGYTFFPSYDIWKTDSDEDGRYNIRARINRREDCVGGTLELSVYIEGRYRWSSNLADQNISCTEGPERTEAINLIVEMLSKAKTLHGADLDTDIQSKLEEDHPHLLNPPVGDEEEDYYDEEDETDEDYS